MAMIKIREAINQAIDEEMDSNKKIFLIGEEVGASEGAYKVSKNLLFKYPKRVFDTPICEAGFTGLAVGASYAGLIPICEFMTFNFAMQAIDHIVNSAAKMRYMSGGIHGCHIVFRGPNGFAPGVAAQHTQDFCAWYGSVPGLKVLAPYNAKNHRGITKRALRDGNPVVILENEYLYEKEFVRDETFSMDYCQEFKCSIEKEGEDVTVIGISLNVGDCIKAAEELEKEDIHVEVINLISIRPLDLETIYTSVKKTKKLIIVDNGWPHFSVASEISASINEKLFGNLKRPVVRINGKDCPTGYAASLEKISFPTKDEIVKTVKRMVNK